MSTGDARVRGTPALDPGAGGLALAFFVLGAQKAGTTSLHDWLSAQPEIGLPALKETHYLSHPERRALGAPWYARCFGSVLGRRLLGEVDPEYLYHPAAAHGIRQQWPGARLVAVLRKPLERALSHHRMSTARGLEPLGFEAALEAEESRLAADGEDRLGALHHSYLLRSRYTLHLEAYRRLFPAENLLLVRFDELFGARSAETFHEVCRFLGVDGPIVPPDPTVARNASWSPRSKLLARALRDRSRLRRVLGRLLMPSQDLRLRLGVWLERRNRGPAAVPRIRARLSRRWVEAFDRETEALERLAGWDLGPWYGGLG